MPFKIPALAWKLIGAGALILVVCVLITTYGTRRYNEGIAFREQQYKDAAAKLENEYRERENTLRQKVTDLESENSALLAQNRKDQLIADKRVSDLRLQLDQIARALSDGAAGTPAAALITGKTTTETARVLAVVLREALAEYGEVAKYADDAAAAGGLCEKQYTGVTDK